VLMSMLRRGPGRRWPRPPMARISALLYTTPGLLCRLALVLWPGAAAHLASAQGLGMAVLEWHLMGTHGLSAGFTVDAGCKAFPVSAFMLFYMGMNLWGESPL
jgi:hypothetical protein